MSKKKKSPAVTSVTSATVPNPNAPQPYVPVYKGVAGVPVLVNPLPPPPPPPTPPAPPKVQLTDEMKGFLRSYRNGANTPDPVPLAEAHLVTAGLAGIALVRDDQNTPGDAFAFPTDEATKIIAEKLSGTPVYHHAPQSGTGPVTLYQFNGIILPYSPPVVISASVALKEIAQQGLDRYRWTLASVFGGSRDGLL